MQTELADSLLIFGASARAAAFSALRAGLRPWCADLFADRDLRLRCHATRVAAPNYPHHFLGIVGAKVPGSWIYTGGLENRRRLVGKMERVRQLWGNGEQVLRRARSPEFLASLLASAKLPFARVGMPAAELPQGGDGLTKPIHGSGGRGIRHQGANVDVPRGTYWQEFIEGEPYAAVYVASGGRARLAGVTRQLVGESWLNAGAFQYCGSIGPVSLPGRVQTAFAALGDVLAAGCGLRGLFGVDCVLRADTPYPVEVNPRYTASIEVVEHASGWPALAEHRAVFDTSAPSLPLGAPAQHPLVGKAILFAKDALLFPDNGPWMATLRSRAPVHELPAFADIPQAGERIERGSPILTFFVRGASVASCNDSSREIARDLDHRLSHR